jgi:hypothetical protein
MPGRVFRHAFIIFAVDQDSGLLAAESLHPFLDFAVGFIQALSLIGSVKLEVGIRA